MAKISQKARMVYIEPNDLATGGEHIDNVVWNPEDFSMFVDLQVIIPDRNYDGSISYDNTVYSVSVQNNRVNNKFVSFIQKSLPRKLAIEMQLVLRHWILILMNIFIRK